MPAPRSDREIRPTWAITKKYQARHQPPDLKLSSTWSNAGRKVLQSECGQVQITMNRTEVLEATGPTSGTRSWVRLGAKRDGKLVAADVRLEYEAGAYPGSPVAGGARCALGPYLVPDEGGTAVS